jgi:hypothetical protein
LVEKNTLLFHNYICKTLLPKNVVIMNWFFCGFVRVFVLPIYEFELTQISRICNISCIYDYLILTYLSYVFSWFRKRVYDKYYKNA